MSPEIKIEFTGQIIRRNGSVTITVMIYNNSVSITRTFSSSDPKTAGIRMGEWLAKMGARR